MQSTGTLDLPQKEQKHSLSKENALGLYLPKVHVVLDFSDIFDVKGRYEEHLRILMLCSI